MDLGSLFVRGNRTRVIAALRANDAQAVQRIGDTHVAFAVQLDIERQRGLKGSFGFFMSALRIAQQTFGEMGVAEELLVIAQPRLAPQTGSAAHQPIVSTVIRSGASSRRAFRLRACQ